MRRREVMALLCGATLAWSSAGRAQQPPRISVGLLADGRCKKWVDCERGFAISRMWKA